MIRRVLIVAFVLGTAGANEAQAYRCIRSSPTGPSLVWGVRNIAWWMEPSVAELDEGRGLSQAQAGFAAWSLPECTDIQFPFAGLREGLVPEYRSEGPNRNVVVLLETWPYDEGAIAITTTAYDSSSGVVLDADIELNGETFRFGVVENTCPEGAVTDLGNTITHEVGHLLGLDHPPASARYVETTMFAQADLCETKKRSLAADDIEGVCAIYPADQPTAPCFPPDQLSFQVVRTEDGYGCAAGGQGGFVGLGLLVLLGLSLRSRRS